ncbi:MAG: DegT/DnrJ/EryC1/StrS family aminotransferase [Actinomycetota bacterium]
MTVVSTTSDELSDLPQATVPFADLTGMHAPLAARLDAVWQQTLATSGFIGGALVDAFEASWAGYCGRRHAVGVANGTDAIALALKAFEVGAGDEVLVPANTFIASAEGVVMAGATPVFVDVDAQTLLVDVDLLDAAVTARTVAVLVVHLYGHIPDMDAITAFAKRRGLAVIEDAAQAHGATWNGRPAGSFGAAATFSFYPGKNLGAFGDGGAVVLDDDAAAARIRSLAFHGRAVEDRYLHPLLGINSRLDALQAGILSVKLDHLDEWTAGRRRAADRYLLALSADAPEIADAVVRPLAGCASAWHLFVVRVADRERVRAELAEAGIETGIHYPVPCHRQGAFAGGPVQLLPVAERAAASVLSLPMFPHLSDEQVDRAAAALISAVRL